MNDNLQHTTIQARDQVSAEYWELFYSIMNEDICPALEAETNYFKGVEKC